MATIICKQGNGKKLISLFMGLVLVATFTPMFLTEDANKDQITDLKDVIIAAKLLAKAAEAPQLFINGMKIFVSTINVVGNIKPATITKKPQEWSGFISSLICAFAGSFPILYHFNLPTDIELIDEPNFPSLEIAPDIPPPRGSLL